MIWIILIGMIFTSACTKEKEEDLNDNIIENNPTITVDLVSEFDWRDSSIVTPAKAQGSLGSCGVFAAMGALESAIARESGVLVDLSEQHYINASDTWDPSTGVSPMTVFDFIKDNGIVIESRLPYQARKTDELPTGDYDFTLSSYKVLALESMSASESRKAVKKVILEFGPIATAMDFMSDLDDYTGGVYVPGPNSEVQGGHWVVIVGWKDDSNVRNGGYWIIKNSNGSEWGENGCFKIPYTLCGLVRYVITYPIYNN